MADAKNARKNAKSNEEKNKADEVLDDASVNNGNYSTQFATAARGYEPEAANEDENKDDRKNK